MRRKQQNVSIILSCQCGDIFFSRIQFEKLLDMYNISLNEAEIGELLSHFGAEDGECRSFIFDHFLFIFQLT